MADALKQADQRIKAMRQRIASQFDSTGDEFEEVQFLATLSGYKGNMRDSGMDITLAIAPGEKNSAWPVTNAGTDQLLVTIKRVQFDGTA